MSKRKAVAPPPTRSIEIGAPGLVVGFVVLACIIAGGAWVLGRAADRTALPSPAAPAPVPTGPSAAPTNAVLPPTAQPESGTWYTPDGDPAIGSPSAPVLVVEYGDYQCPNCRQFTEEVMPWLKDGWLGQGFVAVAWRDYAIRGDESYRAAEAAHCAGEQGRYWSYHDALFAAQSGENQGTFSVERLSGMAVALGLDGRLFDVCLASGRYRPRVQASTEAAAAKGFDGTPTYLVNGHRTQGAIETARWDELFQAFQQDFVRATQAVAPPADPATATP